ncbi:hypothetical protein Hamer_G029126 [Homarus americanus]|uniref:Uncharacterized protein n=1 Tax=Homarus americanus TaxID=6706 RepID=A0A8J5JH79_HOMAM|nr:hypothetical protein Hamer_G029126 [Homarus americanus]
MHKSKVLVNGDVNVLVNGDVNGDV